MPSVPSAGSLQGMAAPGGAVPPATAAAAGAAASQGMPGFGGGAAGAGGDWQEHGNTLDEPVWETLKRDALTIGRNLRSVLVPIGWDFANSGAALTNWDLWGPLIFMLGLAITLSAGERKPSDVFAVRWAVSARGGRAVGRASDCCNANAGSSAVFCLHKRTIRQ